MSKKRLDSVREKKALKSFSSVLRRVAHQITQRLSMSVGGGNSVYVVNDMHVKKSEHPFPRKIGREVPKAKKTIFQRR